METMGSLMDKYSIARNRHLSMTSERADIPQELIEKVEQQMKDLQDEIDEYIYKAINGDIRLEEPKFKIYKGEKPSANKYETMGAAMSKLFLTNWELWCLEDQRREKDRTDKEIRLICDDVATKNRIRNDCMDDINRKFQEMINDKNRKGSGLDS